MAGARWAMLPLVGSLARRVGFLPKLQILDPVVVADAVAVMDSFARKEAAPKMFGHHKPVFECAPSTVGHRDVGTGVGHQDAHVTLSEALLTVPVDGTGVSTACAGISKFHARATKDLVYRHRIGVEGNRKRVTRAVVAGVAPDHFSLLCV